MKKTIINYGFISGGLAAIFMIITGLILRNRTDFSGFDVVGYVGIILSGTVIFFGIRSYRDKYLEGTITFGKAFATGLMIAVISGICYAITWLLVAHFLIPDFADKYAAYQIEHLKAAGKSAEEIAKAQADMDHYKELSANPLLNAGMAFLEPFPVGLIISLISAAFLRRKPKTV